MKQEVGPVEVELRHHQVANQFASLGSNILIVVPGKTETTGALPGMGGAPNDLSLDDFDAIVRGVRQVERAAPISMATTTAAHGELRRQVAVIGTTKEFLAVRNLSVSRGTFLPEGDIHHGASVAVIGERVVRELFPGTNPLGGIVRIDGWRMRVIGVLESKLNPAMATSHRFVRVRLMIDDCLVPLSEKHTIEWVRVA